MDNFKDCTPAEVRRLSELLKALRVPCETWLNPDSRFYGTPFFEEFSSRLFSQHVFLGHPMMQESFDSAFMASAAEAELEVHPASSGQRFWDVEIDGSPVSLKTTKAKGLKRDLLHISKLTEAAWIQDCRTASSRQQHTFELFREYTSQVVSIFQFRYFVEDSFYELVEIPVDLMKPILEIPRKYFTSDGPSIMIPIGASIPDFTLKLDRSDAKITMTKLRKDRCVVHATWDFSKTTLR